MCDAECKVDVQQMSSLSREWWWEAKEDGQTVNASLESYRNASRWMCNFKRRQNGHSTQHNTHVMC